MFKEIMMNDDNLESNLLTSSLLKTRSLYKFVELQVEPEICVVPKLKYKLKVSVTGELLPFIQLVSS